MNSRRGFAISLLHLDTTTHTTRRHAPCAPFLALPPPPAPTAVQLGLKATAHIKLMAARDLLLAIFSVSRELPPMTELRRVRIVARGRRDQMR
jgi:hypothetical protein